MSHIIEADYGGGILLICGGDDEAKEALDELFFRLIELRTRSATE